MMTRRSARMTNKNSTIESEVQLNRSTDNLTEVQTAPKVLNIKKETSEPLVETLNSGEIMNIEINLELTDFESVVVSGDFYQPAPILPSGAADNCSSKECIVSTNVQQLSALLGDSNSWMESGQVKCFNNDPSMTMVNPQDILHSVGLDFASELSLIESSAVMSPISYCSSEQDSPVSFAPDSPLSDTRSRSASFVVPDSSDDLDEPMQILEDILGLEGEKSFEVVDSDVKFLMELNEEHKQNSIEQPLVRNFVATNASNNLLQVVTPARRESTASIMTVYPELEDDLDSLMSGFECNSPAASPVQLTHVVLEAKPVAFPVRTVTPPQSPLSVASTSSSGEPKKSTRGRKRKLDLEDVDYEVVTKVRKQTCNKKAAQNYRARRKNSEKDVMKKLEEVTAKNVLARRRLDEALSKRNMMLEIACECQPLLERMPAWVKPWFAQRQAQKD